MKKSNSMSSLLAAAAIAVVATSTIAARSAWDNGARQRQADYLFMEAQRQNAIDNPTDYFEMLNLAYELDTTQTAIGHDLGYLYMAIADNDSTIFREGYEMMDAHFRAHPDDYYSSFFFGTINDRMRFFDKSVEVWSTLDSLFPNKTDVAYKLADALSMTGDTANLRRAVTVYDRLETFEGKSLALVPAKIRTLYALRDSAAISDELHSLLASSPRSAEYNVYAGDLFSAMGYPDSALYYLNRACELDSTNGLAHYKRANLYRELGDSVAFDRETFNALSRGDLDLSVKLSIFKSYIQELYSDTTQYGRIDTLFDILIDQYPHEVEPRDLYSAYLSITDRTPLAVGQTWRAVEIDPSDELRWRGLISMYIELDEYDGALKAAKSALEYHPQSAVLYMMEGIAYNGQDNVREAIKSYSKGLERTQKTDDVLRSTMFSSIGDAYYSLGEADSAFVAYRRAIEINPGNEMAMNNCAYFMACEGRDLDEAEQMSAITVRNDPKNATYLDTYAWILFKKGDYESAREYIDMALEVIADEDDDRQSAEVLNHAGDIYFKSGKTDEALKLWQRALVISPTDDLLKRKVKQKTYLDK